MDWLLEFDEIIWHQRSRVNWLKYGDKNTSFFHKHANYRVKRNLITGILDDSNRWHRDEEVIYKIISKTLAMRMKKVLPYVISEYQSVFIPNRMILDNVLAAFETIHCLKRRGKRGRKKLALKLDMAKAYDRVEWAYLEKMMYKIEFPSRFVALVMNCVTSVSYFILMNDRPHNTITPSGESGKVTQYPRICS